MKSAKEFMMEVKKLIELQPSSIDVQELDNNTNNHMVE